MSHEDNPALSQHQGISWIPYPRPGTSLSSGRWLASVELGTTLETEILELEMGQWYWPDGSRLGDREKVVAVAHVPVPYRPAPAVKPEQEGTRPARSKP